MRAGLLATKRAAAATVGTVAVDRHTRVGDLAAVRAALASGGELDGYPIATHDVALTREMLAGVAGPDFPVQVRHGSAAPERIVTALVRAGLTATEGGPVSCCLPYGRTSLAASVDGWARGCELLAGLRGTGVEPHLESFGGCLAGQLCPPSLLVAVSVLEGLFFRQHGLRSISLSYAQQTHPGQDREAVLALRRLGGELLPDVERHVVLHTYLGVYPRTLGGADDLLAEAARLAVVSGAARLIVRTAVEAHRVPTVAEHVTALELAAAAADRGATEPATAPEDTGIYAEARALVEAVLDLAPDVGRALADAFRRGYLDVPFCLHPDNAGLSRGHLDRDGRLRWARTGAMPLRPHLTAEPAGATSVFGLLTSLSYVERKFDDAALERCLADAGPAARYGRDKEADMITRTETMR